MKRFSSSEIQVDEQFDFVNLEEKAQNPRQGYSREFQAMLDSLEEEDFSELATRTCEKKRRLSVDQVKALEKNFEVENKLEPERKLKLAEELNLQPRQVAIWFQNRRARWKTKQLEREYGVLKANYEALKLDYSNLEQENVSLTLQAKELKAKLEEKEESSEYVKEESPVSESENNVSVQSDNNNSNRTSTEEVNWIRLCDSRSILGNGYQAYQHQLVKLEEQSLFNSEESCNFFSSVDQPPTLHWQFLEQ